MHPLQHRFADTRILCEGEEPEVDCSSFTNNLPILTSDGSITIYVPRAFQRAAPRPLIRPPAKKNAKIARLERISPMSDIRSSRSSHVAFGNQTSAGPEFE